MTLVDTNVLFDLITDDPEWSQWSALQLERLGWLGSLIINDVIYAELSARFVRIEAVDDFVSGSGLAHGAMPRSALFLAAKAHSLYRAAGGTRTGVLSDFFIGAHATVAGIPLLTRDPRRYRTYFPNIILIAP
ncbi:MAG: type II toxin-antitoxin system VapC family toxin [Beijerinckiaceae bacterium]|nr:type II toxin-antitoxin system VapC family toxin [Beijerinckiaceae bacterium]